VVNYDHVKTIDKYICVYKITLMRYFVFAKWKMRRVKQWLILSSH